MTQEKEYSFIIFSDNPEDILQEIEKTRGIDNYRISEGYRLFNITDTYYRHI